MREPQELIEAYRERILRGERMALATLLRAEGRSYRRPGARLLLSAVDGPVAGLLSGGCLERDLHERARQVFRDGNPLRLSYDLRQEEDPFSPAPGGCPGWLDILIEPLVPGASGNVVEWMALALSERREGMPPRALAQWVDTDGSHVNARVEGCRVEADGADAEALLFLRVAAAAAASRRERPSVFRKGAGERAETVLVDPLGPPPLLGIFGSGADAVPLVRQARLLGWDVSVADFREGLAAASLRAAGEDLLLVPCGEEGAWLKLCRLDALIAMSHHLEADARLLHAAVASPVPFIGLLGPRERGMKIAKIAGVACAPGPEGEERFLDDRIHSPVGLDLGGEEPVDVALSALAQVQAFRNRASTRALSDFPRGPLHARPPLFDWPEADAVPIDAIVLAAGASRRLGAAKQLFRIGGESLVRRAARNAAEAGARTVIVVHPGGSLGASIVQELDGLTGVVAVESADAEGGQAQSVRSGIAALLDWHGDSTCGALLLPCDLPQLQSAHLRTLITAARVAPGNAVATAFDEAGSAWGAPAVFPREGFSELATLEGDAGGRKLLREGETLLVFAREGMLDLDTPEDALRAGAEAPLGAAGTTDPGRGMRGKEFLFPDR